MSNIFSTTSFTPGTARTIDVKNPKTQNNGSTSSEQTAVQQKDSVEISGEVKQQFKIFNKTIKPLPFAESLSLKNTNLLTWGLGLGKGGDKPMFSAFISKEAFRLGKNELGTLTNDVSANWKTIDANISKLLEDNGIQLSKDETLNFKVDQNGKIKVGDGVEKAKAEKIEELLNSDESLGNALLLQHAKKSIADAGLASRDYEPTEKERSILINNILQTETGSSLTDVVFDSDASEFVSSNEPVLALLNEEPDLAVEVRRLLTKESEDGAVYSYEGSFEVSYSYRNGTTIDNELADDSALAQRKDRTFQWIALETKNKEQATVLDFDSAGNPKNGWHANSFSKDIYDFSVRSFSEDTLRLHQFENGDSELGEHYVRTVVDKGEVDTQVISPEADAVLEEEIQSIGQHIISALQEKTGFAVEGMDIKFNGKDSFDVEFSGDNLKSALLRDMFNTFRSESSFQSEMQRLTESLQQLHRGGKGFSIRVQ